MSRHKIPDDWKSVVKSRASSRCEYCLCSDDFSSTDFEIDLIIPESRGGQVALDNIAFACRGCNGHKYNKTEALDEITDTIVPLFNPRRHNWNEHFAWDADPTYLIGLTQTGRATIDALQLNRPRLLRVRRNFQAIHRHPPLHGLPDK